MGLISSVQTLLHYSSLHQVCSYSYPGFEEFPPIHAVRNILLSLCCPSGWHSTSQFSLLEATTFCPTKQKTCSQEHPTPAPATKEPLPPEAFRDAEGRLLSFHPFTDTLSLHSFMLLLPLPAWFLPEEGNHHTTLVSGGQERDRAGSRGNNTSDVLLHLPKTPEPGSSSTAASTCEPPPPHQLDFPH